MAKTKKLRIIALGGLGEIGKNLTLIEYSDNIIVIDCGMGFPDDEMPGVDAVIPDISYLESNSEKIRGIFLTHGHEDHIGALPYVLKKIHVPVYGTRLTLGILKNKFAEHVFEKEPELHCVNAGEHVKAGVFDIEFIRVNHSIADAVCFAIRTPVGTLVHTGDFKIDTTPVDGKMTDLTRLGEIGNEGVKLLMCESTNIERPGYTPSEKKVGESLFRFFETYKNRRIIISTFSSNVHRVQQIINTAFKYGRKVAVTGRSMINVLGAAMELGYMNIPEGELIDISEIKKYPPSKVTIVSTGSQGEPMSALYRMAYGMHNTVELGPEDVVIISANAIPGNEKLVGNIVNELYKKGVRVLNDAVAEVHVSGHACQEEIKIIHALTNPEYFMPVHGEERHLYQHKEIAESMGMDPSHIFVAEIGQVLEIDKNGAAIGKNKVQAGDIMVDGYGIGDVGTVVLRDRKLLAMEGLINVTVTISQENGIVAGPEVLTRGFVYAKESEKLIEEIKNISENTVNAVLEKNPSDKNMIKSRIKEEVTRFVITQTKRRPMILPIVMIV